MVAAFVTNSNALSLPEAANLLPHHGKRKLHVITIKRWIIQGCRGVRLAGTKVGNEWFTTREALAQFQIDCTVQALSQEQTPQVNTAAAQAARDALLKRGFRRRQEMRNGTESQSQVLALS